MARKRKIGKRSLAIQLVMVLVLVVDLCIVNAAMGSLPEKTLTSLQAQTVQQVEAQAVPIQTGSSLPPGNTYTCSLVNGCYSTASKVPGRMHLIPSP